MGCLCEEKIWNFVFVDFGWFPMLLLLPNNKFGSKQLLRVEHDHARAWKLWSIRLVTGIQVRLSKDIEN